MPTIVNDFFKNFCDAVPYQTKWGTTIGSQEEGVYVVSLSNNPKENTGLIEEPEFNKEIILSWFQKANKFRVDGKKNFELLKKRLSEFWLPDENILYIGKAPKRKNGNGLGKRIDEYYRTEIGAGSPHSGGQWIKTLNNLSDCYVYYAPISNPSLVEEQMLSYFMVNVSNETKSKLRDPELPLPFANIRFQGRDKDHGMENQRN